MKRLSILYLEDSGVDVELVRSKLDAEGIEFDLLHVETRAEFIAALDREQLDIILTDYALPAFDGMDALSLAAGIRPDIPVIMVSGSIGEEIAVEILKKGATDYVLKWNMERLAPAVQRALKEAEEVKARRQVEEALRLSEERLMFVLEGGQQGFWDWDIETGYVQRNTRWAEMLGYELQEIGSTLDQWTDLIHPDDQAAFWKSIQDHLEGRTPLHEIEYRMLTKDGQYRWILDRARIVRRTSQGQPLRMSGTHTDITKRAQAEEERELLVGQIRAQARQMKGIIDTVPDGMFLLDAEGSVIQANPVARGYLSILADAKVGDRLTHLGERSLAELLTSPPSRGLWHEVKVDDRIFEVIDRPVEKSSGPEDWVLVVRDVTQEREIEWRTQQQERLAAVGQLAAGIAHDFNNIMAVIVLYTQMGLRMPGIPPQLRERLETVSNQAHRATDLIQQVLDFSRRSVLERRPMDLTPFLKEIVKLLERTVPESIKIRLSYGPDEYTVNADPTRMQQAIMNLVVNARDAMLPKGGGEVHIELDRIQVGKLQVPPLPEMSTGEWVRVEVADNGSGMAPEVLAHIFEPFFTTKEVGKGTGLGLAQVYGIVRQHEGHIDVSTEAGGGTTFTLYLPALLEGQPETTNRESAAYVHGKGETVMVVEDNAALREALVITLEQLDYRVLAAADGLEALNLLEQSMGTIELVLSDLVMPEMGGQALFSAMRQRGMDLPVVILSGHPMENELETLQAQGLTGWMPKPPDMEELARLLSEVLHK